MKILRRTMAVLATGSSAVLLWMPVGTASADSTTSAQSPSAKAPGWAGGLSHRSPAAAIR